MYFPYLSKRSPSNRECRFASVVSMTGFTTFAGGALAMPASFGQMLVGLVVILTLTYFGLGTLFIAKPNHFLLWPQRETKVILGQEVPPLDERDLNIRYRTFLTSYRILAFVPFAMIVFIHPGAILLVNSSAGRIPHWRLEVAEQMFVVLIWLLAMFLPYWVFPWLESDVALDDKPAPGSGRQNAPATPSQERYFIRNAAILFLISVSIFCLIAWLLHNHV